MLISVDTVFSEDLASIETEYVTEELGMCYCNKEKRTETLVKNVMMTVLIVEESNAMDSIRVVVFDARLLRDSRQMEIDFVNQLDVYYRRPR